MAAANATACWDDPHCRSIVVPGTDSALPQAKATASRLRAWWSELGFPADDLHAAVTLTPSCGLAGASPAYARAAMTHVREAARYLLPE